MVPILRCGPFIAMWPLAQNYGTLEYRPFLLLCLISLGGTVGSLIAGSLGILYYFLSLPSSSSGSRIVPSSDYHVPCLLCGLLFLLPSPSSSCSLRRGELPHDWRPDFHPTISLVNSSSDLPNLLLVHACSPSGHGGTFRFQSFD